MELCVPGGDVNTRRMSLVSVTLLCDSNTDENRFDTKKSMKEILGAKGWVTEIREGKIMT